MKQRLQKVLAAAGVASRRKAEEMIAAGRVSVNGQKVSVPGTQVDPATDLVVVDGRPITHRSRERYILLYKPPGCVTTLSDPQGRPTAAEYLGAVGDRVFPVGRLDWDAEGALLFTTDGELANRLAHPRYGHRRTYLVKVKGDPAPEALARMLSGVRLEDGPAQALEAANHERTDKNTWLRVVVGEGRKHLVKRLCESVGLEVQRLFRPEFGGVSVQGLRPGRYRELGREEVESLRRAAGMARGEASPAPSPGELPRAARRHGHGPPEPRTPERRPSGSRSAQRREAGRRLADPRASEGTTDGPPPARTRPARTRPEGSRPSQARPGGPRPPRAPPGGPPGARSGGGARPRNRGARGRGRR